MPRSSCERMTPEFPRAPISEPWATARHRVSMSALSPASATASATEVSVSVMFVPVSPSGTG